MTSAALPPLENLAGQVNGGLSREDLAYCPRCKPSSAVAVQPGGLVICLACGEVFIFGADLVSRYLTERDVAKPQQQRKPVQRQRQIVPVKMSVKQRGSA